jgi:hypothetical protein
MADIKVTLDISALSQYLTNFAKEIHKDVEKSIGALAKDVHTNIKEKAQNNLHSFREKYLENLSPPEQIDTFTWVITLKSDATWIEEGIPKPYDMKEGLLNTQRPGSAGKIKTSKDGHKYRVVPMNQGKTPSEMSPNTQGQEQMMVDKIRAELKKQMNPFTGKKGVPYKQLEYDKHGSPRLGKLHSFDFNSPIPGKGNTPQLHGVTIFQTKQKDGSTKRSITTFRTVTDKDNQKDKWIHPPVEARDFFQKAREWAEREWESKILPALVDKYK